MNYVNKYCCVVFSLLSYRGFFGYVCRIDSHLVLGQFIVVLVDLNYFDFDYSFLYSKVS